jgi:hypothetical protein
MVTVLLATRNVHQAATLCDYLTDRLDPGDRVHAVGVGGDTAEDGRTDVTAESAHAATSRDRADALNAVRSRLGAIATVETDDLEGEESVDIESAEPADSDGERSAELLVERARGIDADEIVLGDATLARELLDRTDRPLVFVPA